jgi:hypothetical protein
VSITIFKPNNTAPLKIDNKTEHNELNTKVYIKEKIFFE